MALLPLFCWLPPSASRSSLKRFLSTQKARSLSLLSSSSSSSSSSIHHQLLNQKILLNYHYHYQSTRKFSNSNQKLKEMEALNELEAKILKTGDKIKAGKAKKQTKDELAPLVAELLELKTKLKTLTLEQAAAGGGVISKENRKFDRASLESLLTKRFFVAPSFEIYGGVAGLFDYGPPGSALQNNILFLWRQHFVLEEDMLEIECTNLTPEAVLKTSGHVERFADYMVKDIKTGDIFRADHLVKAVIKTRLDDDEALRAGKTPAKKPSGAGIKAAETITPEKKKEYEFILETLDNYVDEALAKLLRDLDIRAPETGNPVSDPVLFNLMFDTQIGPTGQFKGFLRPETAQGHFLNFKRLLESNNEQMPFASASIGKSFRNEISPRQGLLRVREFTMCEIEHYVHPERKDHPRFHEVAHIILPLYSNTAQLEAAGSSPMTIGDAVKNGIVNNETLGYFLARIYLFLLKIGIDGERIRFRQHMANEMAHYASDCWDAEIKSSYGWIESVGCADRSAFDLSCHTKATGVKLIARETIPERVVEALVANVVKSKLGPAFGKNAKQVLDALAALDEETLKVMQTQLKAEGHTQVKGADGVSYKLTPEMLSIALETKKINVIEYTPNVIEPSFGIGRILYALLEHSYYVREEDEQRAVFRFPAAVAPTKALVVPLSKNVEFDPFIKDMVTRLRKRGISNKVDSSSGSIGKRYARNDEVGTPFGITIDFDTVKNGSVTLRERDSTKQIRGSPEDIVTVVDDLVEGRTTWKQVVEKFGEFVTAA